MKVEDCFTSLHSSNTDEQRSSCRFHPFDHESDFLPLQRECNSASRGARRGSGSISLCGRFGKLNPARTRNLLLKITLGWGHLYRWRGWMCERFPSPNRFDYILNTCQVVRQGKQERQSRAFQTLLSSHCISSSVRDRSKSASQFKLWGVPTPTRCGLPVQTLHMHPRRASRTICS